MSQGSWGKAYGKKSPRVPVGPFREWLLEFNYHHGLEELSRRSGVPERSLRRAMNEHKHVTLDMVDRCVEAHELNLMYPYDGDDS